MKRKNFKKRPRYDTTQIALSLVISFKLIYYRIIITINDGKCHNIIYSSIHQKCLFQEINRRNRRIIKQTFDSDVLEISETPSVTPKPASTTTMDSNLAKKSNLPQTEAQNANSTAQVKVKSKKSNEKTAVNAETDDWESLFDDNGCLDSKLMSEITANVGKVTITKPKNDYKTYQEPVNLDDEEFPHVLEVSNFPIEFKTQDLMMIFSEYKDSGFDIKWVDDTHALVVFSSSKIGT